MNCRDFENWLDEGMPASGEHAHAHSATCAACADALRIAHRLDALLSRPVAPAPASVIPGILARVDHARSAARTRQGFVLPGLPWWVSAASQPAVVLAVVLAGILGIWGGALWESARTLLVSLPAPSSPRGLLTAVSPRPDLSPVIALGLLPAIAWASSELYTWATRIGARTAR